jgi:hypothetical protein
VISIHLDYNLEQLDPNENLKTFLIINIFLSILSFLLYKKKQYIENNSKYLLIKKKTPIYPKSENENEKLKQ